MAASDDHVLGSTRHEQIAVLVDTSQITRDQPSVRRACRAFVGFIHIARRDPRSVDLQHPYFVDRAFIYAIVPRVHWTTRIFV